MISDVKCPSCGAPLAWDSAKAHWRCEFCGSVHVTEPDSDGLRWESGATGTQCPVCGVGLVRVALADLAFEGCERCHGLLIPIDIFLPVVDEVRQRRATTPRRRPHPFEERELQRSLTCPRCGDQMDTHPYAGSGPIVIDNCPRCELNWLDHGELRQLASAAEPEPPRESPFLRD